jgi:hypothetical protein
LAAASAHRDHQRVRMLFESTQSDSLTEPVPLTASATNAAPTGPLCPKCRAGHLQILELLRPRRKFPP